MYEYLSQKFIKNLKICMFNWLGIEYNNFNLFWNASKNKIAGMVDG